MSLIKGKQIIPRTFIPDNLVELPLQVLSSVFIDMTQTSVTDLLTIPSGKIAIILGVLFEATTVTTVTGVPSISIGISSGEIDIFPLEVMQSFDQLGDTWSNWLVFSSARAGIAGEIIKMNLTGASASSLVANVKLVGFFVDA